MWPTIAALLNKPAKVDGFRKELNPSCALVRQRRPPRTTRHASKKCAALSHIAIVFKVC
jgi:hypothetical protein